LAKQFLKHNKVIKSEEEAFAFDERSSLFLYIPSLPDFFEGGSQRTTESIWLGKIHTAPKCNGDMDIQHLHDE